MDSALQRYVTEVRCAMRSASSITRVMVNKAGAVAKALGTGFVPIRGHGRVIAYATAPRKKASDMGEKAGPYAKRHNFNSGTINLSTEPATTGAPYSVAARRHLLTAISAACHVTSRGCSPRSRRAVQ